LRLASFIVLLAPAGAQDGFDALFARAQTLPVADLDGRRQAFAVAFRAFSRLPIEGDEYRRTLARGARSALYSARPAAATALFADLHRRHGVDDRSLQLRLIAMVRAGQGRPAIVLAKAQVKSNAGGVQAWLRGGIDWLPGASDFGRLAAFGGERLQAGDPDGLWLLASQDEAMRGHPGREFALANLGLAYLHLGRAADAERTYRAAVNIAPGTDWLWNDFGLLLKGLGRFEEAFQMFVAAARQETKPGASAAGTNLGVLFQRTGNARNRDPQADLQRILANRPAAAMARRLLLDGLAKGR